MNARIFTLLILSAISTVAANLLMRGGINRNGGFMSQGTVLESVIALMRQPMFVTGFLLYGLAAMFWFNVVATGSLSTTYPLLVSLTFVMVTIGAAIFFNEQVTWQKILGITIILVGFVIVARAKG
jgi:multidrug transporter EmrE-like cation transporter